jgi:hypothetical protein
VVDSGDHLYRIEFLAVRVLEAGTIRQALRQTDAFGANDITAISREDA